MPSADQLQIEKKIQVSKTLCILTYHQVLHIPNIDFVCVCVCVCVCERERERERESMFLVSLKGTVTTSIIVII